MMRRALAIAILVVAAIPLMLAMAELPPYGSPDAPAHNHVAPRYLERGYEETGSKNIVGAVLLNYRGLDTQGEVTVIFTAMAAVFAVLALADTSGKSGGRQRSAVSVSVIVRFIVRVMAPFVLLFSAYVIVNHVTPGGGFQGGMIAGALIVALTLIMSDEHARRLTPVRHERLFQAAAPVTFFLVGLAGLALTGDYLAYPHSGGMIWLAALMLTIIEAGIGVGGAMVIATIFRAMRADR